jgi:integrase
MLTGIAPKFVPFVALGAFAGLRTAEIHRLEWQDIDFHGGHIIVGKHKAKTGQRRIIPVLPALKAWLEPLAQLQGKGRSAIFARCAFAPRVSKGVETLERRIGAQRAETLLRKLPPCHRSERRASEFGNGELPSQAVHKLPPACYEEPS